MTERTVHIYAPKVEECYRSDAPHDDPMKPILARAQRAREAAVAIAETAMLREEVKKCYVREGVNHHRNCVEITKAYMEKLKQPNFIDKE